jgi:hypothetical protein
MHNLFPTLFNLKLFDRSCRMYDYAADRQKKLLPWEEVTDHPLKPLVVTVISFYKQHKLVLCTVISVKVIQQIGSPILSTKLCPCYCSHERVL